MTASVRFEFRIDPTEKEQIERAASNKGCTTSEFVRLAALDAARGVLDRSTVVPGDYFERLTAELDGPVEPNRRVALAVRRLASTVSRATP